jgi:hypothetical protein
MRSSRHSRYATVAATAALVLSLTAPVYAVTQLAASSVGTKQLKDDAVTGAKIKDGTVQRSDLDTAARPRPPRALVAADSGSHAVPSDWTDFTSIDLPAGTWLVTAKGIMYVFNSQLTCDLVHGDAILDRTVDSLFAATQPGYAPQGDSPMVLVNTVTLSEPGTVTIRCSQQYGAAANDAQLRDTKLVALEVR